MKISLPQRQTPPPWSSPGEWREVLAAFTGLIDLHGPALAAARARAKRVGEGYLALNAAMEELCAATCPHCPEVCCEKAWIFYDWQDLLFLVLTGGALPPGQIVRKADQPCPKLGARGCVLERTARPFACTWYLCPAQKGLLAKLDQDAGEQLQEQLQGIRSARREMEAAFISVVSPRA